MPFIPDTKKQTGFIPDGHFIPDAKIGEIKKPPTFLERTLIHGKRKAKIAAKSLVEDLPIVRHIAPEIEAHTVPEKVIEGVVPFARDIALWSAGEGAVSAAAKLPWMAKAGQAVSRIPKLGSLLAKAVPEAAKGMFLGAATSGSERPAEIAAKSAEFGAITGAMPFALKGVSGVAQKAWKHAPAFLKQPIESIGKSIGIVLEQNKAVNLIRKRYGQIKTGEIESEAFIKKLQQALTPTERRLIPFLKERTLTPKVRQQILRNPQIRERYKSHIKPAVKKIGNYLDDAHKFLMENYGDDIGFIENFVPHMWRIPKNKAKQVVNWFITRNPHLRQRRIATLKEGIQKFGLTPKYDDITDILRVYDQYKIKAVANLKFAKDLNQLKIGGTKLVQRADKAPVDWKTIDHPALRRAMYLGSKDVKVGKETVKQTKVVKEVSKGIEVTGASKPMKKLEAVIQDALEHRGMPKGEAAAYVNKLKAGGKDVKQVNQIVEEITEDITRRFPVKVPVLTKIPVKVAPEIYDTVNAVFQQPLQGKELRALAAVNSVSKYSNLTMSLFHHTALSETGLATGLGKEVPRTIAGKNIVNSWNPIKMIRAFKRGDHKAVFKNIPLSKDAVRHGLELGQVMDVEGGNLLISSLAQAERNLRNIQGNFIKRGMAKAGIAATKIRRPLEYNNKYLWEYLHSTYKLSAYEKLTAEMIKKHPDKAVDLIKNEVAQFVNDTFGGQVWELLGRSPQWRQFAHMVLLSPDWTLSTLRQALSPFGVGAAHPLTRGIREELGQDFWRRGIVYFLGGMNILNYSLTKALTGEGRFMWENPPERKTHLFIGHDELGAERYLRWGKQFRELPEFLLDPLKVVGRKASPVLRQAMIQLTGYTTTGWKTDVADKEFWSKEGMKARASEIAKMGLPFSVSQMARQGFDPVLSTIGLSMPISKGMTKYSGTKLFIKALEANNPERIKEVYAAAIENNLNPEAMLKSARSQIKREGTKKASRKAFKAFRKFMKIKGRQKKVEYLKMIKREFSEKELEQFDKILKKEVKKREVIKQYKT